MRAAFLSMLTVQNALSIGDNWHPAILKVSAIYEASEEHQLINVVLLLYVFMYGCRTKSETERTEEQSRVQIFPNEWLKQKRLNRIYSFVNLDCQGRQRQVPLNQKSKLNHELLGFGSLVTSKIGSKFAHLDTT